MAKTTAFLFGVHAHQPVGNFPFVMDDAHRRCYQPFLHMMYRFPDFPFAIHISGWLFDYLHRHYPEDVALLREMVQRGQAEIFGAGYTEPVLAAIPALDRIGQIERMSDLMEHALGQRPLGAWLTERVWDAGVVVPLAECGVRYSTVDDYHFMCAGKSSADLSGYFSTEDGGRRLDLFPISEALRYRLPFSPADEAVRYLESLAGENGSNAAIYFDDIEKFGVWPETYEWVYERGWLTSFIEGVLASGLIKPMRFCDYHAQARTRGVIYLPTTSYIEMNEWTLPAAPARRYAEMVNDSKQHGNYEADKPFLRGGIWRNFLSRYPEANWMHKRMVHLSSRYHALPTKKQSPEMLESLYEAQANDAYWHGLFGGLYLPHLRRAVYNALVRLEAMLDRVDARPAAVALDMDMSGYEELFLQNGVLQAVVTGDGTASLCELDAYQLDHNFADTLARREEHYHHKVMLNQASQHEGAGISNPHERVSFKHAITPEDMVFDTYRRTLFLDRIVGGAGEPRLVHYGAPEMSVKVPAAKFVSELAQGALSKEIQVRENTVAVSYRLIGEGDGHFEVELNIAMPSCDGPAGSFRVGGVIAGGFGQAHRYDECSEILLQDEVLGGALAISASVAASVHSAPCFSVSQSEGGFEKIMQAVTLRLSWSLAQLRQGISLTLRAEKASP